MLTTVSGFYLCGGGFIQISRLEDLGFGRGLISGGMARARQVSISQYIYICIYIVFVLYISLLFYCNI